MISEEKAKKARAEFLKDFNDLLKKHKAEIESKAECGITVYIDAVWNEEGKRIQDQIEIDFGDSIAPSRMQF